MLADHMVFSPDTTSYWADALITAHFDEIAEFLDLPPTGDRTIRVRPRKGCREQRVISWRYVISRQIVGSMAAGGPSLFLAIHVFRTTAACTFEHIEIDCGFDLLLLALADNQAQLNISP